MGTVKIICSANRLTAFIPDCPKMLNLILAKFVNLTFKSIFSSVITIKNNVLPIYIFWLSDSCFLYELKIRSGHHLSTLMKIGSQFKIKIKNYVEDAIVFNP